MNKPYLLTILRRLPTAVLRGVPDFIIIGAQKAGTTALYSYLIQHPTVLPALKKEVHFFDNHFRRTLLWYRVFFPYRWQLEAPNITGEASPYYLFHPYAFQRVSTTLPHVKLIVLLRNPVDRAYSHYFHEVRAKRELRSFEDAIDCEIRTEGTETPLNRRDQKFKHRYHSYLARGRYAEQLEQWLAAFSRDRILVLHTEDLKIHTAGVFRQVTKFLQLPEWSPPEFPMVFKASYDKMNPTTRARLTAYFAPHNKQLYSLLGRDFEWDA